MAQINFTTAITLGGAESSKLSIDSATLITATNLNTRADEARATIDKGAGGITDGYSWTQYWKWTAVTPPPAGTNAIVIQFADVLKSVSAMDSASDHYVYFAFNRNTGGTANRFFLNYRNLAADLNNFTFLLNNQYKTVLSRSGTTQTALVYDIDGGHGTPGALVDTLSIVLPIQENWRYAYAINTHDDAVASNVLSFNVGPMDDGLTPAVTTTGPIKAPINGPISGPISAPIQ